MTSTHPSAIVSSIQLTEFSYNPDRNFPDTGKINLKVSVGNRVPPGEPRFDVLIKIDYLDKDQDDAVSIMSASCVTVYDLVGMKIEPDEDGDNSISIPLELVNLMKIESIAHARALVSLQAANTPFNKTYASLGMKFISELIQAHKEEMQTKATK